jgi:hypothetical protein
MPMTNLSTSIFLHSRHIHIHIYIYILQGIHLPVVMLILINITNFIMYNILSSLVCKIFMLKLLIKGDKFGGRDMKRHCKCHQKT